MALPAAALIVGCGDIGLRIARLLTTRRFRVTGWVQSADSAARLHDKGIDARIVDLDRGTGTLDAADLIFYCAPPPTAGVTDPRIRSLLAICGNSRRRLVYISTSGVYGDCGGRWIDEDEPLKPQTDRARRRLDAERALSASDGIETIVLRVPGIYGPGRLPIARLRSGQPLLRIDESPWTNRIHADDLAAAAVLVAERGMSGSAYNVTDGQPTTMTDYFLRCARLLGLPEPPQVGWAQAQRELSASLLSFMEESKRLRNDRLRGLGWTPRYPDLAAGLPGCLSAGDAEV